MPDTVKCTCSHCGAKYRLPVEAQGRTARCKRCGKGFQVPQQESLEDTILTWLAGPAEEEEEISQPRVISMPTETLNDEEAATKRPRGPIRMKPDAAPAEKSTAKVHYRGDVAATTVAVEGLLASERPGRRDRRLC